MPHKFTDQSPIAILKTKISVPGIRHNSIDRLTMIDKLAEGIRQGVPFSLISAPPGYGKTTLAVELLHSHKYSVAWYSIDHNDNDPFRFFSYLYHALHSGRANFKNSLDQVINLGQLPPAETLISYFINEFVNLSTPLILVLEDYYQITDPTIHQAVQFLLEQSPPLLHVILITREDPPFPLTLWRARNRITEIRAKDLRFSLHEARRFFKETMALSLNEDQIDLLETRTEGWITGLQLVGLSLNSIRPDQVQAFIESFCGNYRFIFDYLTETVLNNLPPELKAFICQIAVLERFSAPLCETVTGRTESRIFLKQLEQANLFLIALDPQGEWYRFHHLFADLLRLEVPQQNRTAVCRKAAVWFETYGQIDEAVTYCIAAEDWAETIRLMFSQAEKALKKGKMSLWLHWVELLPQATLQSQPKLMVYRAWALFLTGQFAKALTYVHALKPTINPESLPVQVRGKWLSIQAWLANYLYHPATVEIATNALRLIPDEDAVSTVSALIPLANAQIREGAIAKAIPNLAKAYHVGDTELGYSIPTMAAAINYAFCLYDAGRNRDASDFCHQLLSRYRDRRRQILPLAQLAYIPLGVLSYEANRLDTARDYSLKAMVISRNVLSQEVMGGDAERTVALIQFATGEREAALETLRETRQLISESGFSRITEMLDRIEVELLLRMGDLKPAQQWAQTMGFSRETQPKPEIIPSLMTYVRILIAEKQYQAAETLLDNLKRTTSDAQRNGELLIILLLQVKLMMLLDNQKAAAEYFHQAFNLTPPEDKIRIFLDEGPFNLELLSDIRDAAPAFIDHLKEELYHETAVTNSAVSSSFPLVEPLSERELEILRLVAAGHSNQDIASQLFITVGTTKWHLNNIYGKLGTGSRTQAIAQARQLKILS